MGNFAGVGNLTYHNGELRQGETGRATMEIEIAENDPRTSRGTSPLGLGPRKHGKKTLPHLRQGKRNKLYSGGGGQSPVLPEFLIISAFTIMRKSLNRVRVEENYSLIPSIIS